MSNDPRMMYVAKDVFSKMLRDSMLTYTTNADLQFLKQKYDADMKHQEALCRALQNELISVRRQNLRYSMEISRLMKVLKLAAREDKKIDALAVVVETYEKGVARDTKKRLANQLNANAGTLYSSPIRDESLVVQPNKRRKILQVNNNA